MSQAADFSQLDPSLPLLLLPVRIETVFNAPGELRIRIYPDRLHVDSHLPALSTDEVSRGKRFWNTIWPRPTDGDSRNTAFSDLAAGLGPRRAAWVVRCLTPENLKAQIDALVGGKTSTIQPTFPKTNVNSAATPPRPAIARLLPRQWVAIGFAGGKEVFRQWGRPITAPLQAGPDPASDTWASSEVDPEMKWLVDYDDAVNRGMALTVPLSGSLSPLAKDGLDELHVLGIANGSARDFDDLLASHHYTSGAGFVPQGTPTNNTADSDAGWNSDPPDPSTLCGTEIPPLTVTRNSDANVRVAARALGLEEGSVFERLPEARTPEQAHARAMNRVLWHCSVGALVRQLLPGKSQSLVSPTGAAWLEDWFVDYVRGRGPLPAIRAGHEPYGLLPVLSAPPATTWPTSGSTAVYGKLWLRTLIDKLAESWDLPLSKASWAASIAVPVLSPGPASASTTSSTTAESALVDILSHTPHPARFSVRQLDERRDDKMLLILPYGVASSYSLCVEVLRKFLATSPSLLATLNTLDARVHGIESQIDFFRDLTGSAEIRLRQISATSTEGKNLSQVLITLGYVNTLLAEHRKRAKPFLDVVNGAASGEIGADDPTLFYSLYTDPATPWKGPLVQEPDASGNATAASYLVWLADRSVAARVAEVRSGHPEGLATPGPLLYQLARESVLRASEAPTATVSAVAVFPGTNPATSKPKVSPSSQVQAALRSLAELSTDQLELLTQETLGLASHRLDAWATSLATERLATLRNAKPTGLQIGGYGLVLDLRPAPPRDRTRGFIHAPSLSQAVTAAVLRSGWLGHASDDPSPFAIDLSSDRVRRATWLLDGIRNGLPLERLLGYRFERRLHEARLDAWIDDFRAAATDSPGARRHVIDGLALLERRDTPAVTAILNQTTLTQAQKTLLTAALNDLESTLDAVADLTVAEGTHQLLHGDAGQTVSTLDGLSNGEVPPPQPELPRTQRGGPYVTHRLLLLFPDATEPTTLPGWRAIGDRDRVAPSLAAWAAEVIGDAAKIGCLVSFSGPAAPVPRAVSLADLALGPLEFVALSGADEPSNPEITRRITTWIETQPAFAGKSLGLRIDLDTFPGGTSLSDALILARALRSLISSSRTADARDLLSQAADALPNFDETRAGSRAKAALTRLQAAAIALDSRIRDHPDDTPGLRSDLATLSGFFEGAILPPSMNADEVVARAHGLADSVRRRIQQAQEAKSISDQLQALAGCPTPVPFLCSDPTEPGLSFTASASRQGDPLAALGWLDQVARVRDGAARLQEAIALAEALADARRAELAVIQLPHVAGEPWAARVRPPAGRVSIVAWSSGKLVFDRTTPLAGLVIDEWVERIPDDRAVTGVAFGFDAPSSRPPQALLLALAPENGSFHVDQVLASVRDTVTWSKRRIVDPERLPGLGHYLPAIFSASTLNPAAPGTAEMPSAAKSSNP